MAEFTKTNQESSMESSFLEIKVISCKDLKAFTFFQKLSVYAQVSIVSDDQTLKKSHQRTPIDRDGDGNPEWNHEMRFDLKDVSSEGCDHLFIEFDLRSEGILLGGKTIGQVRVPFKDLIHDSNGLLRYVTYQVRNTDRKPNGVLNFSYKVNDKGKKMKNDLATNENGDFPVVRPAKERLYPTLDTHYESLEVHYTAPPPPEIHYPAPPPPEIHYPASEVYYAAPPPPPPPPPPPFPHYPGGHGASFYPPLPPMGYLREPAPYGGYGYPAF